MEKEKDGLAMHFLSERAIVVSDSEYRIKESAQRLELLKQECEAKWSAKIDGWLLKDPDYRFINGEFVYKPTIWSRIRKFLDL